MNWWGTCLDLAGTIVDIDAGPDRFDHFTPCLLIQTVCNLAYEPISEFRNCFDHFGSEDAAQLRYILGKVVFLDKAALPNDFEHPLFTHNAAGVIDQHQQCVKQLRRHLDRGLAVKEKALGSIKAKPRKAVNCISAIVHQA